ncbi:DUF1275 domain-containing protein [Flavobacterium sp. HXWNR69]|uniref:DUF1275 domain-containing protein n=1 Tax=Flavobacterium fragile TaxID=2949085 RepID=A0ABT0TH56_9FLAO|nr:YoaK family protein [Flavobacterium sp. HXWNR69]MCL9770304.1 DUF1275 domain-containing protein [Flavobacterium sp. HXWNR69]
MFRHKGKTRTLKHNLRIATLLSFVAGIVNVGGFLAVQRLTTNVTGHFAFFVDEMLKLNFWMGFIYFLYIFFFFLGSFTSNLIVEIITKKNDRLIYIIPTIIETVILLLLAVFGQFLVEKNPNLLACTLLFSMGLQNSLVTKISNSTVRTTHLTGLFTDLGIELSQLLFYKEKEQRKKLFASIKLRFTIITFFFWGGILSGVLYSSLQLYVLAIAAAILLLGIFYDDLKFKIIMKNRGQIDEVKTDEE